MGLERTDRLLRAESLPAGLELTPQDYFVLSRVEGAPTVADVLATSGLPSADAEAILRRLLEAGALRLTGPAAPKRPTAPRPKNSDRLRKRVADRKRRTLAAQFQGVIAERPATREVRAAQDASAGADDDGTVEEPRSSVVVPRVEATDPRLESQSPVPVDEQRWILALADGAETLSQFEFLGLEPTHDVKAIKRAFHETSRRLHPDSYYGKALGTYEPILADLFRRARGAYAELRDAEVRTPWVDHHIAQRAFEEQQRAEEDERVRSANALRQQQAEAEAAVRRQQRASARAERRKGELQKRMASEAKRMEAEADAAAGEGNLARAANLYRLALRAAPNDAALTKKWEDARSVARKKRGEEAFARARGFMEVGQSAEAKGLFTEAAEADPTAEHLAYAADIVRLEDKARAREFAMAALDALGAEQAAGETKLRPKAKAALHLKVGRAFLSAGQKSSAMEQANIAGELRPDDPEVRALLKACKAK